MSTDTTAPAKPSLRRARIFQNQLRSSEFGRTTYLYTALAGTTVEDYLEPETWAHATQLRPDDVITVTAEDRTWRCELVVLSKDGPLTRIGLLNKHEFEEKAGKEHDLYDVEWAGPSAKFRVVRKSDRAVMVDKLASKSIGVAWIEENAGPAKKAA